MKNTIFATIFILISVFNATAQNKYATLAGVVTDSTSGEVAIGVSVVLYEDSTLSAKKPVSGSITNKFGFFSIPKIKPGQYYITIRGVAYSPLIQRIDLSKAAETRQDFKLKSKEITTSQINIVADKESSAAARISTTKIDPVFLSLLPNIGGEPDLYRSLFYLPGIKQSTELSAGLYIRGGSPDQNLNLLDGVVVYNPSHLAGFFSVFNTDAIRDLKLVKGAFPAEYGGRLAGVIDMTMKEGSKEKLGGSVSIGLISSRILLEGPINEDATFMFAARRTYFDVIYALADPVDKFPYYFYDLNAKVNYKLSENDRLYLSGFFCRDVMSSDKDQSNGFDINWGNSTGNLRWSHIVSADLFTNFSLIYTNYNFDAIMNSSDTNSRFNSFSRIQDLMLRGEAQYFPEKNHKIQAGAEIVSHNFEATSGFDIMKGFSGLNKAVTSSSMEISLYARDEWEIDEKWSSNFGARIFYFQSGGYFAFEPRLAASYKADENLNFTASASSGNQFLHLIVRNDITLPTDLWYPSTDNIKPSQSYQGVLGMEYAFDDKRYVFTAEAYYKYMKNLYEYKDSSYFSLGAPMENQFTSGTGRAYGLELCLNKKIGDLIGWIGYTLSWTDRTFPELNSGKKFYPRYDRRHDIGVALTYVASENTDIGIGWVYGTGQAYTMPVGAFSNDRGGNYYDTQYDYSDRNAMRLPSYHRLDLSMNYKFKLFGLWNSVFNLSVYNVYNRRNPFMWYIDSKWDYNTGKSTKKVKQMSLFPVLPTFGLTVRF